MQVMTRRAAITGPGAPLALAAAALFGASTPLAKLLLGEVAPWLLAGLLYFGSGIGLAAIVGLRALAGGAATEAPLRHADLPWLGAAAILGGATLLSWQPDLGAGVGRGALAIAGACMFWAVDNNLTRRLSGADPLQIAAVKGLVAGAVNLALALLLGAPWPGAGTALIAGAVGLTGYGVSLVLFVRALRHLGTARTMAYFSTAPFIGAVLAVALLGEPVTATLLAAGADGHGPMAPSGRAPRAPARACAAR